jgi:hypothetical protein
MPFVFPASVSNITGNPPTFSFVARPAVIAGGGLGGTVATRLHLLAVIPVESEAGMMLQPVIDMPSIPASSKTELPLTFSFAELEVATFPGPWPHVTLLDMVNTPAIVHL